MSLKRIAIAVGTLVGALVIWVWTDLADPTRYDLREFDGHEVARLESFYTQIRNHS